MSPSEPYSLPSNLRCLIAGALAVVCSLVLVGCGGKPAETAATVEARRIASAGVTLAPTTPEAITPNEPTATTANGQIRIVGAGNEWLQFTIDLAGLPEGVVRENLAIGLTPMVGPAPLTLLSSDLDAFQLVDVPVEVNRASAVRHAGEVAASSQLPRALLPLPRVEGNRFSLGKLRASGTVATTRPVSMSRVWFDVRIPSQPIPGVYNAACQLLVRVTDKTGTVWQPVASVPLELTVHGFTLPDTRNLKIVGSVPWESLIRHYSGDFEAVTPHLLARGESKYEGAVRTLDALMKVAQRNRVGLIYPRLHPSVKWPDLDAPPEIRWEGFDDLVGPWMTGSAFGDGISVGYWPVPEPENLRSYNTRSRLAYWNQAASHFDRLEWLPQSAIQLNKVTPGRVRGAEAIELSVAAAQLLASHPRANVAVPLEDQQVQLALGNAPNAAGAKLIDPLHAGRLRVAAGGVVAMPQAWPGNVDAPKRWLRADLPPLVPLAGAGGREQDVRHWAWLAFLRRADHVQFSDPLPLTRNPAEPADPADLTWVYPGHWFGVDEPVPSVHLKWLRRAQQDYEYLHLASLKGEQVNAMWIARLLAKPVEVGLGQAPDDAYALMTGTTDPAAWASARQLLARLVELYVNRPDGSADGIARQALEIDILQWARPLERPLLIGRTAEWVWGKQRDGAEWVELALGLDVYNAADVVPGDNHLRWAGDVPDGFEVNPKPMPVPPLAPYRVLRLHSGASFNVGKTVPGARRPVSLELAVDSPTAKFVTPLKLSVPVAGCDRREGGRYNLDGKLDDWTEIDQIHDGPLVRMMSRPAVLAQALQLAGTTSRLYTNRTNDNFYVAFALGGVSAAGVSVAGGEGGAGASFKNFVEYQSRRAWSEDLCEVLVQPVYRDNTVGPVLHVVCKPNGSSWVERRLDPKLNAEPWEPFEGTGTRYAAVIAGENWTGELAIPWKTLVDEKGRMPSLLRFNFSQHRASTAESASWAGPVDFGRDDSLTGLLHLKSMDDGNAVQGAPPPRRTIER